MNETLHTKFGTAKINTSGHYLITSNKEGNHGKYLHRLIWEDFYGCEVPEGYVIHHRNHIKTDNCILNLQLMSKADHNKLHHKKKYATIIKDGLYNGKQRYGLKFNGKKLKRSKDPNKLLNWFLENYPLEIIRIPKKEEL
jgi:hypothetical protein